jgi:dihydroneopterin aldolase
MSDCLELLGARFMVRHGVLPEEKAEPQPFSVDVRIWLDASRAAHGDHLEGTIDYRWIWQTVAAVMEGPSRELVESLAYDIAGQLLAPPATAVEVTVRKEEPPLPGPARATAFTTRRSV